MIKQKIIVFFILLSIVMCTPFSIELAFGQKVIPNNIEQQLIEDILTLDTRVLALKNQIKQYSNQNENYKKILMQKQKELKKLEANIQSKQNKLHQWVLFSYKGGIGNLLSVLVGSETLGEFFRRFDNIVYIFEYYNNIIAETRTLIFRQRQEESFIMKKQREIQDLEEQARKALEEIAKALEEKQRELIRAQSILKDTGFLEALSKNWQKALPSLDYLLKNLSSLPWSSITPDDLKVNYLSLSARAEFYDTSLTKKLFSKERNLENVYFTFDSEGVTVAEKNPQDNTLAYSIKCGIELTEDNKIKFIPKSLFFNGVALPPKVIEELMSDYTMEFILPTMPYNLKITSITTTEGKLIMFLKK